VTWIYITVLCLYLGQCSVLLVSLSCPTACPVAFKFSVIGRIKIDRSAASSVENYWWGGAESCSNSPTDSCKFPTEERRVLRILILSLNHPHAVEFSAPSLVLLDGNFRTKRKIFRELIPIACHEVTDYLGTCTVGSPGFYLSPLDPGT